MTHPRFWSDDLDMDLPRILPDLDGILGGVADTRMWVHGGTSHGRLNHPSVWGNDALFGLSPDGTGKPDRWWTDNPLVECTWREAVRDAWSHTYRLHVNGVEVWDTHAWGPRFYHLMADMRGWRRLPAAGRDSVLADLRRDVTRATGILRELVAAEAAYR